MSEETQRPLPCTAITCPICLERLRALPAEEAELWRAYCQNCARRITLTLEKAPPQALECKHSLAGGARCQDVVRCQKDWPLTAP